MKWTPNLALFAAFCVLHTHARQGSNSESLPLSRRQIWASFLYKGARFGSSCLFPSPLTLLTSVFLMDQTYKGHNRLRTRMASPSLFPAEEHLTRSRHPSYGNHSLQSRNGPDKTARQTVQGADQPTRSTLSASSPRIRRQYQAGDRSTSPLTCIALVLLCERRLTRLYQVLSESLRRV